ncbi:hypothetical protein [Acidiphilium sp. C61]|uniref:hypothetical protein n=1 Tax=Acidiphilium sp. C61 TaxID=1671485 RepID=UPI00157B75BF|nr:hypothetical protein [Acidiphilium sp. C61]
MNRPRPQPPSGKTAQAGRARPSRGFRPESAFGFVTISDGALLAGMIGQALAHAAGQAAIFAPFVHGELHGTMFVIPTFMIGAALGQSYAYVSQQVTLWLPLVRMLLLAHLPLLALGSSTSPSSRMAQSTSCSSRGRWRSCRRPCCPISGAARDAMRRTPSHRPRNAPAPPATGRPSLAWPLCGHRLAGAGAHAGDPDRDEHRRFRHAGDHRRLVRARPAGPGRADLPDPAAPPAAALNAVLFSVTGAAQLGLTAFYGAMALRVSALGYTFGATAALMPVIHVIALVLLATSPFAILLLRGQTGIPHPPALTERRHTSPGQHASSAWQHPRCGIATSREPTDITQ